jgi:glycosyltransferase involved in cell wall biosynthesis
MHVHVKVADRGWILERMGHELASRLDYITVGIDANKDADIQYYITYSARVQRVSPIELAYFTHLEQDQGAERRFFEVAEAVDLCICQSDPARAALSARNISNLTTIPPGVNLERFQPLVRIGVVGRTYHTGRKGEHLVAQVMDTPGIEWVFTGTGWPGPASPVPDADLPGFYRSLDYVLVPALNEGGPMCVLEALACGVPVIAPPVGWVPNFPHIEYRTGDVDDLRRVLSSVVKTKRDLHATVEGYSWDSFASAHHKLFEDFRPRVPTRPERAWSFPAPENGNSTDAASSLGVALLMHGEERDAMGGPSVRVPRTAEGLRRLGVTARAQFFPEIDFSQTDVVHVFNAWRPETALAALDAARSFERPTVFSPIYLDLASRHLWYMEILAAYQRSKGEGQFREKLARIKEAIRAIDTVDPLDLPEPALGYYSKLRELLARADHVVFLSKAERHGLSRVTGMPIEGTIIRNPAPRMKRVDPELFTEKFGVRDYVLCVGRLETRKNQLMLAYALKDSGVPLVLLGHFGDKAYMKEIMKLNAPNVHLIDRLPSNSDLLASAFNGARAFALPSWAEGAPLAALEAASCGTPLVLSGLPGMREYFGDFARYCDPIDLDGMREATLAAWADQPSEAAREVQANHFAQAYSLERYCEDTLSVYRRVREEAPKTRARNPAEATARLTTAPAQMRHVIQDLTTTAHSPDRITGISRVEQKFAEFLHPHLRENLSFCAWRPTDGAFLRVEAGATTPAPVKKLMKNSLAPRLQPPLGSDYLVAGSAWMQNPVYAQAVVDYCRAYNLRLNLLVYDLIPVEFPFWFHAGYTEIFQNSFHTLLRRADRLMAISEATRQDLLAYCRRVLGTEPEVTVINLGDDFTESVDGRMAASRVAEKKSAPMLPRLDHFALCVGAIHPRKNYELLYTVWLRLTAQMGPRTPHLVIVGGMAWNGEQLSRLFKEDKRISQFVHVLEGIGDDALEELYDRCLFTLYPSLYEGWGLPVAESLQRGKICLAADIASIREIVPDRRDLIDPQDPRTWAARIATYATSATARSNREVEIQASYRARSWRDAIAQTIACLRREVPSAGGPPSLYTGEVVLMRDMPQATPLLDAASAPECKQQIWGIASRGPELTLRFRPVLRGAHDLELLLACRNTSSRRARWRLDANGQPITEWSLGGASTEVVAAQIPKSLLQQGDALRIRIRAASERAPQARRDPNAPTIGLTGLCLIETLAAPAGSNAPSRHLSRRARILAALKDGSRVATRTELMKRRLKLRARDHRRSLGEWLGRNLHEGSRAVQDFIQRSFGWRISIRVRKVGPPENTPRVAR